MKLLTWEGYHDSIYLSFDPLPLSVGYGCPNQTLVYLPGEGQYLWEIHWLRAPSPFKKKRRGDGLLIKLQYRSAL